MSEYDIKWRRDSNQPTPEEELDVGSRREALEQIFEEIGVEDEVELNPVGRKLGGDLPYFTIANIVILPIDTAVTVLDYIENQDDEVIVSDELKERIDERHEEIDE